MAEAKRFRLAHTAIVPARSVTNQPIFVTSSICERYELMLASVSDSRKSLLASERILYEMNCYIYIQN